MTLAVVRNIASPRLVRSEQDEEDFEQELVDEYALSMVAAGLSDSHISSARTAVIGSAALTARRPGFWEAELVTRLVCGTIGWNDEDLDLYQNDGQ